MELDLPPGDHQLSRTQPRQNLYLAASLDTGLDDALEGDLAFLAMDGFFSTT